MGDSSLDVGSSVASGTGQLALEGTGAASGIGIGTVYCYDASVPSVRRASIERDEVEAEIELLDDAIRRAEQELETIRFLVDDGLEGDGEAIIDAQAMMLRDDAFRGSVRERIRSNRESAGAAVKAVLAEHRNRLERSDHQHFRDRAGDIVELEKRVLRYLEQGKVADRIGRHSIVVAESLTATDVLRFRRRGIVACVTAEGGPTSHVSIIAKALGLPTVVGVANVYDVVSSGDRAIVDGDEGHFVVRPSPATLDTYDRKREEGAVQTRLAPSVPDSPVETSDGHRVWLRANVELEEELDLLNPYGADGIGLLRTEMVFLRKAGGTISEDRQVELYRQAAEAAGPAGVTVRLLDLGSDKGLPVDKTEENPALGWRGIRMLLERAEDLLRPQLRAILRANADGTVRVLAPMVGRVEEVRRLRAVIDEVTERLSNEGVRHDPDVPLGIMIEVPSSAILAQAFVEYVDFFSIGTNDLTQYTLAVDRGNGRVSSAFDALHPAVLTLIQNTVDAARSGDIPTELCGESAGDLLAVPILAGLGVDALSTSPQSLPAVARVIRQISLDDAAALAADVVSLRDAEAVRRRAQAWFDRHVSGNSAKSDTGSAGRSAP